MLDWTDKTDFLSLCTTERAEGAKGRHGPIERETRMWGTDQWKGSVGSGTQTNGGKRERERERVSRAQIIVEVQASESLLRSCDSNLLRQGAQ